MTSARSKQALAVFFLLASALLVWTTILSPLAGWRTDQALLRSDKLDFTARLQDSVTALETERDLLSGQDSLDVIWDAPMLGEAAAKVQATIGGLARAEGVSLRSITPTKPREMPLTNAVGYRIEAEMHLDKLMAFLRSLEYHKPAFVVERATLRRLNRVGSASSQPVLFLQLDLLAPVRIAGGAVE